MSVFMVDKQSHITDSLLGTHNPTDVFEYLSAPDCNMWRE